MSDRGELNGVRFAESFGVAHGTVKRWLTEGLPARRDGHRVWITPDEGRRWVSVRYPRTIAINRQSFVYVARRLGDGAIKVGFTSDVVRRLNELRKLQRDAVELVACWPGKKPEELAIHASLSGAALGEEWFFSGDIVDAFLNSLRKAA